MGTSFNSLIGSKVLSLSLSSKSSTSTETWPGTSSYGFINKLDSSLASPMASGFLLLACLLCPSRLLADIVYVMEIPRY